MKHSIFSGKSRRTVLFGAITAIVLLLLPVLNIGAGYFNVYDTAYLDLTPEKLYTVSDKMMRECAFLDDLPANEDGTSAEVRMIFCADRDRLIESYVLRPTYYMALDLQKKYDNFKVSAVNAALDPTAVAAYRTTSLSEIGIGHIILTYKGKYRVVSAENFWYFSQKTPYSYNGEYYLASLLLSLTAYRQPIAYFVTGHGETVYDPDNPTSEASVRCARFADLLLDQGMQVKLLDLSAVDRVPEDCAMLIINNPRSDLRADPDRLREYGYLSESDKIERYLVAGAGTLLVDKDYRVSLETLEDLLAEWGIRLPDARVIDEEQSLEGDGDKGALLLTSYNTDEGSYGYSIYKEYATLSSAPRCVISDTGPIECAYDGSQGKQEEGSFNTEVLYSPFLKSGASARVYEYSPVSEDYSTLASEGTTRDLFAVTARMATDENSGNRRYSYIA